MLGRTIYEETKRDIKDHSNSFTQELRSEIEAERSLHRAVQAANTIANSYHKQLTVTTFHRLRQIGNNAVEFYAEDLTPVEREQEVNLALDELIHNKYYGLTLPQRLRQSHLNLRKNIKRSSVVGAKKETRLLNITRVFRESYPFGAQQNWDIRLFLAEAVRLEHVVAKNIAARKSQKLVRWTLSAAHSKEDICDQLARAVNPKVKSYIDEHKFNLSAEGIYFIEDVPVIPHPNCQCVIRYVHKARRARKRMPARRINLIQRIIKAIFK